jgi:DNA replication and repair protein RecF
VYVARLSVVDFRSHALVEVEFDVGVTALVGPNGQGKTNLIEAMGYLSTLGSHRVPSDAPLVREGASRALVRADVVREGRTATLEVEITPGKANRGRINRGAPVRARDIVGLLRTVLFAPEDLALITGDPDGRRKFLDQLIVQRAPRLLGVLSDLATVLRQRSALLKSAGAARGRADLRTLEVWDAKLAQLGAQVVVARRQLASDLRPLVADAYAQVSAGRGTAELDYRSTVDEHGSGEAATQGVRGGEGDAASSAGTAPDGAAYEGAGRRPDVDAPSAAGSVDAVQAQMLAAMAAVRKKELERGVSLIGPHRDDLVLSLGGLPAKGYASHGESWSFALALRVASWRLLSMDHWESGTEPVLLLDDVFAELDARRRERLADVVADAEQVIITAAVPEDVPSRLTGARVDVNDGKVVRVRQ